MPTPPNPASALPTAPSRADPANFSTRADAFLGALDSFRSQMNSLADNAYANAVDIMEDADAAAASAAAAAAASAAINVTANVSAWVSGSTYALGAVTYSPLNFQNYRRMSQGSGTTDPSADPANWRAVGFGTAHLGSSPNQVPLNQYLGGYAYLSPEQWFARPAASATPDRPGAMVFQLTNDTTLVVKVRGSDGTVRSATLTLA